MNDRGHLNKYIRKSRNFSEKEIQYKRKLFCCPMGKNGEDKGATRDLPASAHYKKKFGYLFENEKK